MTSMMHFVKGILKNPQSSSSQDATRYYPECYSPQIKQEASQQMTREAEDSFPLYNTSTPDPFGKPLSQSWAKPLTDHPFTRTVYNDSNPYSPKFARSPGAQQPVPTPPSSRNPYTDSTLYPSLSDAEAQYVTPAEYPASVSYSAEQSRCPQPSHVSHHPAPQTDSDVVKYQIVRGSKHKLTVSDVDSLDDGRLYTTRVMSLFIDDIVNNPTSGLRRAYMKPSSKKRTVVVVMNPSQVLRIREQAEQIDARTTSDRDIFCVADNSFVDYFILPINSRPMQYRSPNERHWSLLLLSRRAGIATHIDTHLDQNAPGDHGTNFPEANRVMLALLKVYPATAKTLTNTRGVLRFREEYRSIPLVRTEAGSGPLTVHLIRALINRILSHVDTDVRTSDEFGQRDYAALDLKFLDFSVASATLKVKELRVMQRGWVHQEGEGSVIEPYS